METRFLVSAATVALLFACCGNDDNELPDNWNGEIRLSSGITVQQTRTDNGSVPDTQIANGQYVGVFISDAITSDAIGTNLKYDADGSGGLALNASPAQTAPYYPATGNKVNIHAYQPYDEKATTAGDGTYDFLVKDDQTAAGDYYASDLLYSANQTYVRQKGAQSLSFAHKLSKVVCKLEAGKGGPSLTGATVEILGAETKGKFQPSNGTFTTLTGGSGVQSTVQMNSAITSGSYIAILPPQTFAKSAKFLKITIGDGVFYYHIPDTPADDLTLAKGNVYTYTIEVNLTGLSVTSAVSAWEGIESNKKSGTAEME